MSDTTTTTSEDTATPAPEDPTTPAAATADAPARSPRTNLEMDVKAVCDRFVLGQFILPEGRSLTPHVIAAQVMADRNDETKVSSGAVAACLNRWAEIGYITLNEKPMAFTGYTPAGQTDGLTALKQAHSARKAAARAAQREANKPAAAAPAAAPADPTPAAPASAPF